jgi:hypothetical protein
MHGVSKPLPPLGTGLLVALGTLRTLDSDSKTAFEIAKENGHTDLMEVLRPRILHDIPSESLRSLGDQLHQLMWDKAGEYVRPQTHTRVLYSDSDNEAQSTCIPDAATLGAHRNGKPGIVDSDSAYVRCMSCLLSYQPIGANIASQGIPHKASGTSTSRHNI